MAWTRIARGMFLEVVSDGTIQCDALVASGGEGWAWEVRCWPHGKESGQRSTHVGTGVEKTKAGAMRAALAAAIAGLSAQRNPGPRVMHYATPAPQGGYEAACGSPKIDVTPDERYVTCTRCRAWLRQAASNPARHRQAALPLAETSFRLVSERDALAESRRLAREERTAARREAAFRARQVPMFDGDAPGDAGSDD